MLEELKKVYNISSREKRLQILTLFSNNFDKNEINSYFGASVRQINHSIKLKIERGILGFPDPRLGKKMSEAIRDRVISFFSEDAFGLIRFLPGKKDFVSLGNGEHAQKRLRKEHAH